MPKKEETFCMPTGIDPGRRSPKRRKLARFCDGQVTDNNTARLIIPHSVNFSKKKSETSLDRAGLKRYHEKEQ